MEIPDSVFFLRMVLQYLKAQRRHPLSTYVRTVLQGHPENRVVEEVEDIIMEQCNQMTEILELEKSSKNNASFGWKIEQTR